jgi:ornithine cyclodeaminase/alanine dehydrogenase
MKIINDKDIRKLNINNKQILEWVELAFLSKKDSILPHKVSITFEEGTKFYNTMPTIMPTISSSGVKIVSRYPERHPSIQGHILLYELIDGTPLAMMDATWITAKRTGAVAYLALKTLAKKDFQSVAVIGLGQTGQSFLDMLISDENNRSKLIKLKNYKDRTRKVVENLNRNGFYNIKVCENNQELIENSDVIVSAVTFAGELLGKDEWFKSGVLVIPIHTRGFQNCDLFFDRVLADDIEHVRDFGHFDKFRNFTELDKVLHKEKDGRTSDKERILSYNIGIALHDIYLARMILDKIIMEN